MTRCAWAKSDKDIIYHDEIWGEPLHDEQKLFAMLILEGQQAGLSWSTILNKWDAFFIAYDNFDPNIVKDYDQDKIDELLSNAGIIRNRLKVNAAIKNSHAYLKLCQIHGSLNDYLWSKIDYTPIINKYESMSEVPTSTELSKKISLELKKLGFTFVGETIIYAYMQAIGMVNDHLVTCFKHPLYNSFHKKKDN